MAKPIMICAGIDTGKHKLDVAIDGSSEQLQVDNTPEGYQMLSDRLRRHRVKRIGIEASGGYEQAVVADCGANDLSWWCSSRRRCGPMPRSRGSGPRTTRSMGADRGLHGCGQKIHAAPDPRLLPFAEQLTMSTRLAKISPG